MFTNQKNIALSSTQELQEIMTVNLNYEYEDSDMLGILGIKLETLNNFAIFIPNYSVGNSAISLKQYLNEEKAAHAKLGARMLLIPYNVRGYHWVGVIINVNNMNHIDEIIVVNSLHSKSHIKNIKQAIREASDIYPELRGQALKEKFGWMQEDFVSCGPLTIENLLTIAKRNLLIPKIATKDELIEIRLEHINVYRKYCENFYRKQKYNINMVASFKQQHKWLQEAGSHFNAYELQCITQFIQLIQEIKNREIKASIMNALCPRKEEEHKMHLRRIREALSKLNEEVQDESDREIFYSLLKRLFGIEPQEMSSQLTFDHYSFKLPYEAIKLIVKYVDVDVNELHGIQNYLHKQIEDDEKFSKNLQEELGKQKIAENSKVTQNSSSKFLNLCKATALRIFNSNNRSLGTVFGCLGGLIIGTILVVKHKVSIAIVGVPDSIAWDVVTVLLASGTGGNLSSYIGATVDILSGEKTVFDLIGSCCERTSTVNKKPKIEITDGRSLMSSEAQRHSHFPFITSFDNEVEESLSKNSEQSPGLFLYRNELDKENKAIRQENIELKKQLTELQIKMRLEIENIPRESTSMIIRQ